MKTAFEWCLIVFGLCLGVPQVDAVAWSEDATASGAQAVSAEAAETSGKSVSDNDSLLPDHVTFERDVMSVLSKAGCNAGTCHGNVNGKGGLFLSLRGQDPQFDFHQLVREARGRRVNRMSPERSLILLKATTQIPHEGGQRFSRNDPEYSILLSWIESGMPSPELNAPRVVRLAVTPEDAVIWQPEDQISLRVRAEFADGSSRDVTRLAVYEPSDPTVQVSPAGQVSFSQPGLVSILVRYLNAQQPMRLALRPQEETFEWQDPPVSNLIDEVVFDRLRQLQINPAPLAEDHVFLRRIFLDLLGILPTEQEAKSFLADTSPGKRDTLIDTLLQRDEFADRWALHWSDILRNEEKTLDAKGVELLHGWLRESVQQGLPLNELAAALLATDGSTYKNPAANYWRAHREPLMRAETTAQVFLGVRLQCAKCHNHPFDRWSQDEYYDWAGLFTGIDYEIVDNKRRDKLDKHEFVGEQIVKFTGEGNIKNARTGQVAAPRFLGESGTVKASSESPLPVQLASWVTSTENRMFARTQANRIWYHVMGRGLVEPVDDLRMTNPASHPELLERLTDEFVASGFDLRHMVRTIVQSRTYQLASAFEDPQQELHYDEQLYARALIRRRSAEQILDAQSAVLGIAAEFEGYPAGTRAGEIAGVERVRREYDDGDLFLRQFGKPERLLACECERTNEPTLGQALSLIGGENLNDRLQRSDNRIGQLLESSESHRNVIDSLFWTALTRPPTEAEVQRILELIDATQDPRRVLEDTTWALLNAKELLFRN